MKKETVFIVLASVLMLLLLSDYAYTQGPPPGKGPGPSGAEYRVSHLRNIRLGVWDRVSDMNGDDPLCVYTTDSSGRYAVTVTDNSTITPAEFRLENFTHTVEIPYEIKWNDDPNPGPGSKKLKDGKSSKAKNADTESRRCIGGDVANIAVTVKAADLDSVPAGRYRARMSITVSED